MTVFLTALFILIAITGQPKNINDKDAKRAKQAEYARQLQQDGNSGAINIQSHHNNQNAQQGGGGGGIFPSGDGGQDDKAIKRAKQMEYNRQLQQDNPQSFQKNNQIQNQYQQPSQNQNWSNGGGYNLVTGNSQAAPHNTDEQFDVKAQKRAKQAEYNRQLQEHEQLKKHNDSVHNNNQQAQLKSYHGQNHSGGEGGMNGGQSGSNGSLPDAGWEIGPLGQPVRKTLAVGNRGVQKAYTAKKHSPRKPDNIYAPNQHQNFNDQGNMGFDNFQHGNGPANVNNGGMGYGQNNNFGGNNDGNAPFNNNGQNGFNSHVGNNMGAMQDNVGGGGGNGTDMFGNPQSGPSRNNNQSEYARAIEEQIRIKKVPSFKCYSSACMPLND